MSSTTTTNRSFQDEAFEIEALLDHQPKKKAASGCLSYTVKWVGYPSSDNSLEDSWQFETLQNVLKYWKKVAEQKKTPLVTQIVHWHRLLHEWQKERVLLRSDDWHSINHVTEWITKYDWTWQLQEFKMTPEHPYLAHLLNHYATQVNMVALAYANAPQMEFENQHDEYLLIPWKQLLFGIEDQVHPVAKDTVDPFGLVLTMQGLQDELMRHNQFLPQQASKEAEGEPKTRSDGGERGSSAKKKYEAKRPFPASKVCLKLKRSPEQIWELRHMHAPINEEQCIMPLTGEIADVSVANECMRTEGEFVAMSGFIQLTEDLCLDRRYRCGFDRYLRHSCNPNCYVDVVEWNGKPVAMVRAARVIEKTEVLTLDFFTGFKMPASVDPTKFFAQRIEHIFCACGSSQCRTYLWEDTKNVKGKKSSKVDRLHKRQEPFYGLVVAEIEPRQQPKEDEGGEDDMEQ